MEDLESNSMMIYQNPLFKEVLMSYGEKSPFYDDNMELEEQDMKNNDNRGKSESDSTEFDETNNNDFHFEIVEGIPSIRVFDKKKVVLAKRWQRLIVVQLLG